jgi:hypothetical protein
MSAVRTKNGGERNDRLLFIWRGLKQSPASRRTAECCPGVTAISTAVVRAHRSRDCCLPLLLADRYRAYLD